MTGWCIPPSATQSDGASAPSGGIAYRRRKRTLRSLVATLEKCGHMQPGGGDGFWPAKAMASRAGRPCGSASNASASSCSVPSLLQSWGPRDVGNGKGFKPGMKLDAILPRSLSFREPARTLEHGTAFGKKGGARNAYKEAGLKLRKSRRAVARHRAQDGAPRAARRSCSDMAACRPWDRYP